MNSNITSNFFYVYYKYYVIPMRHYVYLILCIFMTKNIHTSNDKIKLIENHKFKIKFKFICTL